MRMLLIDDSSTARSIVKRMVHEYPFEITEAENGNEALSRLKEKGIFDLALVDWNMPIMNGLEFVKSVRSNHLYDKMILIMVTTEIEISRMTDALTAGANEYIMKPFTKDILIDKLRMTEILKD